VTGALFTPVAVGPMTVPNRICETTNTINAGRADGLADDAYIEHHVAKARGGTGWIGGEAWVLPSPLPLGVDDEYAAGGATVRRSPLQHPDFVARMRGFTGAVHDAGSVAVAQLVNLGPAIAPSPVVAAEWSDLVPHELDADEIAAVVDGYRVGAARLAEAGVDGIEVHCAHESLPHLFLSPATNRRTDAWGGSTAARARFVIEVVAAVREGAGPGVAVGVRAGLAERRRGGYDTDELCALLAEVVAATPLDYVSVDAGHSWGPLPYVAPSFLPRAAFADRLPQVRAAVGEAKLLFAGRVTDVQGAADLVDVGACDLVGMTRAGIADPEFAAKARAGHHDRIRPCIGCNRCIAGAVGPQRRPACSVNPTAGAEGRWRTRFRPTARPRRVLVAGLGPAGFEAGRVAALRGHDVVVVERRADPGGQVALAARTPGRDQFAAYPAYMSRELARLGVDVRYGVDAAAAVPDLTPDVVVCATGAVPAVPAIPGVDRPGVVQAWDVVAGRDHLASGRVVVVAEEDHLDALSAALVLAARGIEVEVVHRGATVASAVDRYTIGPVLAALEAAAVTLTPGWEATAVAGDGVELRSSHSARTRTVTGLAGVVLACGAVPDTALHRSLRAAGVESVLAGASWAPRGIHEASRHGMHVGLEI
jgi:2,4-dienoyl-CoA reductase-like NADH-dependent reductase (Old Yellow Enzyme family)/thioredoxin reductase